MISAWHSLVPAFCIFMLGMQPCSSRETTDSSRRSLYAELGGHGGLYSINYENKLTSRLPLHWNAGFSIVPLSGRAVVDFPVSINWVWGRGKRKAELGTGQVLILSLGGGKGGTARGTFRLGYRYGTRQHYWRFAYTPFYSYLYNFQYEHWFGIAYGYKF